jgi:hypothetical protein
MTFQPFAETGPTGCFSNPWKNRPQNFQGLEKGNGNEWKKSRRNKNSTFSVFVFPAFYRG